MITMNRFGRSKRVVSWILSLGIVFSILITPIQGTKAAVKNNLPESEKSQSEKSQSEKSKSTNKKQSNKAQSDKSEDSLSEALKSELSAAAEKLTDGIKGMTIKDSSKRVSGMLGAFSKGYEKVKKDIEAKRAKASASASISISGSVDDDDSKYKKSDVLTYKYNSKMDMKVTDKEYEILCRIVEAEAGDQDVYGRILVVNVILNRVFYTKEFEDDIEGVVFEKNQFSPISNGAYYSVKVDDVTREAVNRALKGEDYSDGALYFIWRSGASKAGASYFDTLNFLFKYGCHEFYKY